jgi:hypothetical protein
VLPRLIRLTDAAETVCLSAVMRGLMFFTLPILILGATVNRRAMCGTELLKAYPESNVTIWHYEEPWPEANKPAKWFFEIKLLSWYDCPSTPGALVTLTVFVRVSPPTLFSKYADHRGITEH